MAGRVLGIALTAAGASAVLGLGLGLAGPASAAPTGALGAVLVADGADTFTGDGADPAGTDEFTGDGADPAATSGPGKDRGRRLTLVQRRDRSCDRIPEVLARSKRLGERLAADASTPGSIAYVEALAAKAAADGDTQRATRIKNRLAVLEDYQALLPDKVARLEAARDGICVDVAVAAADQEPWQSVAPPRSGDGKRLGLVQRLDRTCDRIPALLKRSQRLGERLGADASTRGSVAHLEALAAKADAAGDTERATKIRNRLAVRKDVQALLPARVERLEAAQAGICVDVAAVGVK
ncbi:hypothetical protein [Kineosporia sp. A_224]|uniref:hypothetical protein n=1 Tax=Kineosporia sp. A_224 TaxID=1962180 RepID=UPI000B4B75A7|nr:hypothetical protein [Kineosporia sp. A_224]